MELNEEWLHAVLRYLTLCVTLTRVKVTHKSLWKFSKVSSTVILYSKSSRELTYQNFWYVSFGVPVACLVEIVWSQLAARFTMRIEYRADFWEILSIFFLRFDYGLGHKQNSGKSVVKSFHIVNLVRADFWKKLPVSRVSSASSLLAKVRWENANFVWGVPCAHRYIRVYMYTYIYIYGCTYICIHMYVCMYRYIYIYKLIYVYYYVHTYMFAITYEYVYVYIHTCVYMYIYIYTYIYRYTYICVCMYEKYVCTHIYTYIHIDIQTCLYIHIYIYMHIRTNVYIYTYKYMYIYLFKQIYITYI